VIIVRKLFFMEFVLPFPSKVGGDALESRSPDLRFSSVMKPFGPITDCLLRAFPFSSNSGQLRVQSPLQLRGQWRIRTALPVRFLRVSG
jgi:hypothetical protein